MRVSPRQGVEMKKPLSFVAWLVGLGAVIVAGMIWLKHPADRPECPHDWAAADSSHTNHFLIPDLITNVAEYHDCQRFLVKDEKGGLKYDSLEAIFVRYHLDSVYGIFRGSRDEDDREAIPSVSAFKPNGLEVVGQVLSYGDYAPLGIKTGSDCLVLSWNTDSIKTNYKAWMVAVDDDGDQCKTDEPIRLIERPNARRLDVALVLTVGVVPPVSRWDWDAMNSMQYIGIACPTGWCEVHSPGSYRSSPVYGGDHSPITKGWYDEQYLATYASGKLVHDNTTFGTVYPDPQLANQTVVTYRSWQPVAWVALRTASSWYQQKLNFDPASPLTIPLAELAAREYSGRLNEVELCFVPAGKNGCEAIGQPLPKNCAEDSSNQGTWYARETPPVGVARAPTITCVEYRSYPGPQAPAVVRWRWQKDDETMWISCPSGCCQVKVKQ